MSAATDELVLLERVFLRLGTAETDEQLQAVVCKFLPPVLLKLSSTQERVRTKVMEILIHINKRVRNRPQIQLPVEALLLQYQDPAATSFITNFTIIYIKMGYPRMDIEKQAELIPSILNAVEGKPLSHQDSLFHIIMPALANMKVPMDADKRGILLGIQDKPMVVKNFLSFMLDMLILPYGAAINVRDERSEESEEPEEDINAPPGLCVYSFKRVIGENPFSSEQLEQIKLGIVKFISAGVFPDSEILLHLIVAATDTRYSVANLAELQLKKIIGTLDWSSAEIAAPLYSLFLGSDAFPLPIELQPDMKETPACTRIRLKLLHYLCRVSKAGFIFPACIQVLFESLYGNNTNPKLKSLALQFTLNIVQQCEIASLTKVARVFLNGILKLLAEEDDLLKPMAYTIVGQLGRRIPDLVNKDLSLLGNFFDALAKADGDLRYTIQNALISMSSAFVIEEKTEQNITMMNALLSSHISSPRAHVRFVAVHYTATVLPVEDPCSRYLLLLASSDKIHEVSSEALKALYVTTNSNERDEKNMERMPLPEFTKLVLYVHTKVHGKSNKAQKKKKDGHEFRAVSTQIVLYLRLCLAKSAKVPVKREQIEHPCESSPLIGRYLDSLMKDQPEVFEKYLNLLDMNIGASKEADQVFLSALLEVLGTMSFDISKRYQKEISWLKKSMRSTKEIIRELSAKIYAFIIADMSLGKFENQASDIINLSKDKLLEVQHGSLLALAYMMERKLINLKVKNPERIKELKVHSDAVEILCSFLCDSNALLMSAASQGIGLIGKTFMLPLPDVGNNSKLEVTEKLISILINPKLNSKLKETATISLGYLCIGEQFPHVKMISEKIIEYAQEIKDVEIHLTLGESLVCCVQGKASLNARDAWRVLPNEQKILFSEESDQILSEILNKLFEIVNEPHPNSRQAVCVFLLSLLKYNADRPCIKEHLSTIQNSFMNLISTDNEFVQDAATKGLYMVYNASNKDDRDNLVSSLLDQFINGRKDSTKVTSTNVNLNTYREICSLASDWNNPDLMYQFLNLVNHNSVWASKKGAAFGFSAFASVADSAELKKYLPIIVPKLFRYQFDPNPKIQESMLTIWRAIVPSTSKAIEEYHKEMLEDLTISLTDNQWRVRKSSCNALAELLRSNISIDLADKCPSLWKQLFRVMDDVHEATRSAAESTAKIFSQYCVRRCDILYGKAVEKVLQTALPVLLNIGVVHNVNSVRKVSLETVSQLVKAAGSLIKPFLVDLIPALLNAAEELDSPGLNYFRNACCTSVETQNSFDEGRANEIKNHYSIETITKCLTYIDASVLKELMPKVFEIMKFNLSLGVKVACAHFLILMSTHFKSEMRLYAHKILSILFRGLKDRNITVRRNNANAIGYVVGCAEDASIEKLSNLLCDLYMEREDDSMKLLVGQVFQSINNHNQEIMNKYKKLVLPLTFFAMHAEKATENERTIETWTDLWGEISAGTEIGIRQNLSEILNIIKTSMESASWSMKIQAANAVFKVAEKLGSSIDDSTRSTLLNILINSLQGRTWPGKERLLSALSCVACNSKETLKTDSKLSEEIVEVLYRESKKEAMEYRRNAIKVFSEVLHELNIDKFTQFHDLVQEILPKLLKQKSEDNDDDTSLTSHLKRTEDRVKFQETIYESLGRAWPFCKETQDKYCLEFVNHCKERLPNSTRVVQIAIWKSLNLFVDKLVLFKVSEEEKSQQDRETLTTILEILQQILKDSLSTSKYTGIRKEALNMIFSLAKKMLETNNDTQFKNIAQLFEEFSPVLTEDNQPEIHTRVVDIKNLLNI